MQERISENHSNKFSTTAPEEELMIKVVKHLCIAAAVFALTMLVIMFSGCSGSSGGVSSEVVMGTAAVGAPLSGHVSLKDASLPAQERSANIGSDGTFAIDVTDMKAPYVLQAKGSASGENYTLHSFAEGAGIANINPLSDIIVASAAGDDDPEDLYEHADLDKIIRIKANFARVATILMDKLQPLLKQYHAEYVHPITSHYSVTHRELDEMFDHVKITVEEGIFSIRNRKSEAIIFSAMLSDIASGTFNDTALPSTAAAPATPTGLTANGGTGQVTLSWNAVSNATSYNLYYASTAGVTPVSSTKIAAVSSPHVLTGLAAGTTYYFVVTAVNSSGESAATTGISAVTAGTPPVPSPPAAPIGVIATGGTNQVTISWSANNAVTSYNVYYATSSGVTKASGTKIAAATNPVIQTGLAAGTTYYYIVTGVNSAGEGPPSVQVAASTLAAVPNPTAPSAPTGVTAVGGDNQATISWPAVAGAASYNLYWSTLPGVTKTNGSKIAAATSPYVKTALSAGTTYFFIVSAVNTVGESAASAEVSVATHAPPATICGSCHAIPPALGRHTLHASAGYNCDICHGAGYSRTAAAAITHMNGVKNVNLSVWNATTRTCTSYCHGGKAW